MWYFSPFIKLFVPLWPELVGVGPVLGVTVQDVGWDGDHHSFGNGHSVDLHVLLAGSLNPPPEGVEPEGFIHCHVEIFQFHYGFVGERGLRGSGRKVTRSAGGRTGLS